MAETMKIDLQTPVVGNLKVSIEGYPSMGITMHGEPLGMAAMNVFMLVGAEIDWIALNAWDLSKYFEFISIDVEDGEAKFRATELLNEVTKKK